MKIAIQIFVFLICFKSFSQEDLKDTTWFNKTWNECQKPSGYFYRVYKKTEKGYLIYDKYLNGNNQMIAEASVIKPKLIKDGYIIFYDEKGSINKKGFCKDNKYVGVWHSYFENGKDSSVYEYIANEPVKYIRKSPLQKEEVYTIVEKQAEFPGGIPELGKFIQTNLKYPEKARTLLLGGKVLLRFIVNESGDIDSVIVIRGTGDKEMDSEAIRVVEIMPKWKPATMTGRKVRCYFNLPISYSLNEPFYLYNVLSKNEKYLKIANLIFQGNAADAYFLAKEIGDNDTDIDLLYDKAILYFVYTDKYKSCEVFKKINQIADQGSNIYKYSSKFYNQYCSN